MLYFLYGQDTKASRQKLHILTETLLAKKPDASVFKLILDNWSESALEELSQSQALFENKYIVIADGLFENPEAKEIILAQLEQIKDSPNIFIFLEGVVDAKTIKKIEKNAEKAQEFRLKEKKIVPDFNIFSLTDAFSRRDKSKLWSLYQRALYQGSAPEEVHGILFWQIKTILLALSSANAGEAGLKPFVFNKASSAAKNFAADELRNLSFKLVSLYHDARRGIKEFETGLEKFILEI